MLDRARELAARGHYPMMIEPVLAAKGFTEAAERIVQPHVEAQGAWADDMGFARE